MPLPRLSCAGPRKEGVLLSTQRSYQFHCLCEEPLESSSMPENGRKSAKELPRKALRQRLQALEPDHWAAYVRLRLDFCYLKAKHNALRSARYCFKISVFHSLLSCNTRSWSYLPVQKGGGGIPSLEMAGLPEALSVMPPPCQAGLTHLQVGTSKSETLPWLPLSGCNL